MRRGRNWVGWLAFGVLGTGGCSSFGAAEQGGAGAAASASDEQPALPPGAPPPVVNAPSDDQVTEGYGVFVAPHGAPGAEGTRAQPLASITEAIAKAAPRAKRVYVCTGTYKESVSLVNAVSLIGGLDCTGTWKMTTGARSRIEAPTSPALRASDITSDTSFLGFTVVAPDGTEADRSSIGLIARRAKHLKIGASTIMAGNGMAGVPGEAGAAPVEGATVNGGDGTANVGAYIPTAGAEGGIKGYPSCEGGAGGVSTCGGGAGGAGGTGGVYACVANPGPPATRSWAVMRYTYQLKTYVLGPFPADVPANQGSNGHNGAIGANGTDMGVLSEDGYMTSDGIKGGDGGPGFGGAGGPGGVPPSTACSDDTIAKPGCGSGGGAGGCGALAGTAGTGGGASVGASVFDSEGLVFDAVQLHAGTGGDGGAGSFGTLPTLGGMPGATLNGAASGGRGGRGGIAGPSGSGGGGPSLGLAYVDGEPLLLNGTSPKAGKGGAGAPAMTTTIGGVVSTLSESPSGKTADVYAWTR